MVLKGDTMDKFKIIYHILKTLEKALDYSEFDYSVLSAESLGISEERFESLLIMLQKEGYIENLNIYSFMADKGRANIKKPVEPKITLLGLEYLQENSLMKKLRT